MIHINGTPVSTSHNVNEAISGQASFNCRFRLPNTPPALPDFVVIKCNEYSERGGTNILGFAGSENLIPVPCTKAAREKPPKRTTNEKDRNVKGYRIGYKLECAIVSGLWDSKAEAILLKSLEILFKVANPFSNFTPFFVFQSDSALAFFPFSNFSSPCFNSSI